MTGGSITPVFWDGVTRFKRPGGDLAGDAARLSISDGPVTNVNLKMQGAPVSDARPTVSATLETATLIAPAPVELPEAQRRLESRR